MLKLRKCIILLIICTSCSKDYYFNKNVNKIAHDLRSMKEADQMIRNQSKLIDYYYGNDNIYYLLDSLRWRGEEQNFNLLLDKIKPNQNKALSKIKQNDYNQLIKRRGVVMHFIDSVNVIELIKKTKKYGFPSHDRLINVLGNKVDKKLTSSPHLIFVHTPKQYFDKVRKIVIKEYLKGRLGKNACSHIFWHLNGRKGQPFLDDYGHCKVDTLR